MITGEGWGEMEGPGGAGAGDATWVLNLDVLLGGAMARGAMALLVGSPWHAATRMRPASPVRA